MNILLCVQCPSYKKINNSAEPQQQNKWWIPGSIKNIARQQQVNLFCLPGKWKIMQYEHNNKKDNEGVRVENHNSQVLG